MALTSVAFLMAFAAGLGLAVVRGPQWGLYVYLAVFYLDPPSRWWGQTLPDLRWSLLAAVVTVFCVMFRKTARTREPFSAHGLSWIFALYVLWMWIQLPFVVSSEHLDGAIIFTKYLALLYIIYEIVDSEDRVRDFLLAHVAGCFYLGWLALSATQGGRLEGVGGPGINDSNTMAMHFGTGVMIGAALLMTERGWRFWFVLVALPFILNGILLGNSRGAFLGLAVGGLALFRLKPPAFRKQFFLYAALGVVLFLSIAHEEFWTRISTLTAVTNEEKQLDFSAASRLDFIAAQWEMFKDHPFGAGHAGTEALSRQYMRQELLTGATAETATRSSHNTFMSVLVDQGIPGVLLLAALLIWTWKSVRLVNRGTQRDTRVWGYGMGIGAALVLAVVAGQFSPYLKVEVQYWCLALLMSLAAAARSRAVETAPSEQTNPARGDVKLADGALSGRPRIETARRTANYRAGR